MVCSVCIAIAPMSALSVSAAEETMYFAEKGQEAIINAAGLITYAHLYISKEGTTLYITGNCDGDGDVDIVDVQILNQYLVGIVSTLPSTTS